MFALCFIITNAATKRQVIQSPKSIFSAGKGNSKYPIVENPARARHAQMLPTETYRVVSVNKIQTRKLERAVTGQSARKTPRAVSTPFPPRKPARHVKLWPKIARSPARSGNQENGDWNASTNFCAMKGAKKPFPRSTITTGIAGFQPSTLKTFVRPAFLLPNCRMSIPRTIRDTHTAVGMEPKRYAIGRQSKLFKFFVLS